MRIVSLTILLLSMLIATAVAKKAPKTYPEEGKIVGTGTTEHTHVGGSIFGAPGAATTGSIGSRSKYTHTYRIQTAIKILDVDCGQEAMFHSTGKECGGDKPLKVGDVIHFRVEKEWVYIPITAQVANDPSGDSSQATHPEQLEQKLRILSETEAPKENPPAAAAEVQPVAESTALLDVSSTPPGADIEIDGKFVGSTPSSISIKPGDHSAKRDLPNRGRIALGKR